MSSPFKRPESILVIVATDEGEVLLLRRHDPPDYWQSVTGSLEWNESPLAAARRELREETGLIADAGLEDAGVTNDYEIQPPWTDRFAPGVTRNREYVFLFRLPCRTAVQLHPEEHVEYRWLDAREAADRVASHTNRDAILALLES